MLRMRRFTSAIIACAIMLAIPTATASAEAGNTQQFETDNEVIIASVESSGLDGFGYKTAKSGRFTVPVTGSNKATGYITIRIEGASNQSDIIQFDITGPDGGFSGEWEINPKNGEEQKFTFSPAKAGNYSVYFKSLMNQTVTFNCWIYG